MWDIPRYRIRAYLKGLHRSRNEPRPNPAASLRLQRTQAEILVKGGLGDPARIILASVVLNDLAPESLTVFAGEGLRLGEQVQVTIRLPRLFFVSGQVTYSRAFNLEPRVFSREAFPYRLRIEFSFRSEDERQAVREHIEELQKSLLGRA